MAGNYNSTGQDWYQQRLNQIASMMSMQNSDPNYLLGSLIGDTLRKPFQNWLDNKVLPTITGSGNNDNNKQALSLKEELLNTPITGYDINTAAQANNQNMDLSRLGQQQEQPQTQAQINENNNNLTNQAVMQEAQKDNGSLSGNNIMSDLGQNVVNNAISNVFGIPSFYQASSLKTGGEANSYNGQSIEQMLYQQIIDAKNKYASAQQNGDTQGMKQAQQQANGARQLADLYGIKLDVAGEENTVEEVQNRLNKVQNFNEPTYDDIKMQLLNGVLQSKQDYANAQQNNNTEDMQNANMRAEAVRQLADENGISIPEAGSDVSLENLTRMIQGEQAQQNAKKQQEETERINNLTPQELLNQPDITVSPNIFYQRAYQSLSDKGIPEYRARQKASDMAMQYEAKYMNNLQNVMNTTGVNPDGSLTNMGIALLSQATLANNPEMAQLYANQFASPREQWGFARDIDKANLQQKFNQENINTKYNQDIDMLARKTAAQKDVNSFNTGLQLQIRNQSEQNEKIARMNAAQQLVSAGVWDQGQGLLYVLTGKMPDSDNNSSSDKAPAWSRPLAEGFSKAKGTLDAEDIDDFKNEVAKYLPEMDEEDSTYANSMILALEGRRELEAGYTDMAEKYFSGIPDKYKKELIPGY
ncbi:hypothetical protein GXM21_06890 [Megamonas funiformis]|uniref:Uncharacterized protein n=1 Tax=Megamonas funiformis YIT 11815 TaxID=742816 RepID=A0ABP2NLX2_9FIRM|nr:hypothetical protein [Megamonas funiformis]EHR38738.1 hypothetical protein HMPREF9454_00543 [Megamonas funiformis YIT 11815]QIB60128.1 hypothetical protein GXM21_06890 [Megamonas funiformis]